MTSRSLTLINSTRAPINMSGLIFVGEDFDLRGVTLVNAVAERDADGLSCERLPASVVMGGKECARQTEPLPTAAEHPDAGAGAVVLETGRFPGSMGTRHTGNLPRE